MNELRQAFPGQSANEPVFIFLRRHYIAFLPYLVAIVAMIAVSLALFVFINVGSRSSQLITPALYNWLVVVAGTFSCFTTIFAAVSWFDFYFDIHIVTDRRIVDVNQNRLFNRSVSELSLEDVEDVSVEFAGVLATFFNYGQITIQTAGTRTNFHFLDIANPREVASIIVTLAEQAKNGVPQEKRYPDSPVKGVINNHLLKSRQELISQGALKPNEKPGND